MANLSNGFHLFGTTEVNVRSLVIYQCKFKAGANDGVQANIKRAYKEINGRYRHEESNLDYSVFLNGGTFHLHDIFLTERFGIAVTFINDSGQFEFFKPKSAVQPQPLLAFSSLKGEELLFSCHVEASRIA